MSATWRVCADFREDGHARALVDRLEAVELEHDLARSFHDLVFVERHGAEVQCYAGDRPQALKTQQLIESLASKNGWQVDTALSHWDEAATEWVKGSREEPGDAGHRRVHEEIIERERASSLKHGFPDWEVKVECPSHHDVLALAETLTKEDIPNVHRWRYLVVGALDEDSGAALAKRIREEAPEGTDTIVQASPQVILSEVPQRPYAIIRHLGRPVLD
jgi:hypothetical protein